MSRNRSTALLAIALVAALEARDRPFESTTDGDREAEALLRSLPYGSATALAARDRRSGVQHWNRARASPGLNLLAARTGTEVLLVDLAGVVRHRWELGPHVPDAPQHVELLPGGDLLALCKDLAILRFAWNGAPIWRLDGRFHHDVHANARGQAWSVLRRPSSIDFEGRDVPFLEDVLVRIDLAHGRVLEEIPLAAPLRRAIRPRLLELRAALDERGVEAALPFEEDGPGDLFHVNSVLELERDVAGLGRGGDLLFSARMLNAVFVLRPGAPGPRWSWRAGRLDGQHHATVTPDGHVLVFDNGRNRGWSRILEIEPASGDVVWRYVAPDRALYSYGRGAAQRLANGNTLITESDYGRAFEIDDGGTLVWELFAPLVPSEPPNLPPRRATLYRVQRIEGDLLDSIRRRVDPRRPWRRSPDDTAPARPGESGARF